MESKFTREYAEKVAEQYNDGGLTEKFDKNHQNFAKHDFTQGYMKAIEVTNAEELLSIIKKVYTEKLAEIIKKQFNLIKP